MENFDFKKTNFFMSFCFKCESTQQEKIKFLYTNKAGIASLDQKLNGEFLFAGLLTLEEVISKMIYKIGNEFGFNSYTMINAHKWIGKNLIIGLNDHERFNKEYIPWHKKLEAFFGNENLLEVTLIRKDIDDYLKSVKGDNEDVLTYIENQRLRILLENDLYINQKTKVKNKI